MYRTSVLCIMVFAQGCASLSLEECREKNWQEVGSATVKEGGEYRGITRLLEECAILGDSESEHKFRQGINNEISRYCTMEAAWWYGQNGMHYNPYLCEGSDVPVDKYYYKSLSIFLLNRNENQEVAIARAKLSFERLKSKLIVSDETEQSKKEVIDLIKEIEKLIDMTRLSEAEKLNYELRK